MENNKTKSAFKNTAEGFLKHRNYVGVHMVGDFWGGRVIENKEKIKEILLEATRRAEDTPLQVVVHKFNPQGLSGVVLLSESHISVHTWPEVGYVGVDVFTCGENDKPDKALRYLQEVFQPTQVEFNKFKRGTLQ